MLKNILNYAHYLLQQTVTKGETVIDATCGNGNDTLFLSEHVGDKGHVLAFDIQEQAIDNTKQKLAENQSSNVTLILDSHENINSYIDPKLAGHLGGAIFNLGYLPKSDKKVITKGESTTTAIETILPKLKKNGLVVLVIYHGHDGGKDEKNAVLNYVIHLDQKKYKVLRYGFINQKNDPPFIVAIQKK